MHKLLSYLQEILTDSEASPINHVALALDVMDIDNAEDLELTEEESKQWFGNAICSNDVSIAITCRNPTTPRSQPPDGLTTSINC